MSRLVAIKRGEGWSDASVEFLTIPDGMDLAAENAAWEKWLRTVYIPRIGTLDRAEYITFAQWLVEKGATVAEVEEVME